MKSAYLLTAALLASTLTTTLADDTAEKKKKANHNPSGTWVWESEVAGTFLDNKLILNWRNKELTGEFSGESVENSEMRLQELGKLVHAEIGKDEKQLTNGQEYSENHRILFEWVEALQNVEFEPGEELEKRLAA